MEEMREMIGERRNNKEMEDMNRRLEMELENEREMEHLRELTTDSEREITVICKAAQDQWFGLIEACKHSVYVNNVWLKFMLNYLKIWDSTFYTFTSQKYFPSF